MHKESEDLARGAQFASLETIDCQVEQPKGCGLVEDDVLVTEDGGSDYWGHLPVSLSVSGYVRAEQFVHDRTGSQAISAHHAH